MGLVIWFVVIVHKNALAHHQYVFGKETKLHYCSDVDQRHNRWLQSTKSSKLAFNTDYGVGSFEQDLFTPPKESGVFTWFQLLCLHNENVRNLIPGHTKVFEFHCGS